MIRPHGVRRAREVVRPVYPGYVFLKIGGWDMRGPVSLPIMAQWVRFGGKVEVVSCRVVEGLRTLEGAGELVKEIKYVNPYHTGVAVRVHLPVCDLAGIIVKLVKNRAFVDTHLCRVMVPIHTLEVV
jgi:hypothetical protein